MSENKYFLFDKIILGYLLILTIFILIFGRPISNYFDEIILNTFIAIIIVLIARYFSHRESKILIFLRLLYPMFLFTVFYEQTGGFMHLIFPDFFDFQLTAFEKSIMGVNPTLWLDSNLISNWLSELLMAGYFSFYPMIPVYLLALFFTKRYEIIIKSLVAMELVYFISYFLFFLYPIEGPRYFFENLFQTDLNGPIFRPAVVYIQTHGSVHGGCMPSSHIGVSLVIMIFCLKYFRKAGIILIPINIGLALGAVYGRYHYLSDILVGAVIGVGVTYAVMIYYRGYKDRDNVNDEKKEAIKHVS